MPHRSSTSAHGCELYKIYSNFHVNWRSERGAGALQQRRQQLQQQQHQLQQQQQQQLPEWTPNSGNSCWPQLRTGATKSALSSGRMSDATAPRQRQQQRRRRRRRRRSLVGCLGSEHNRKQIKLLLPIMHTNLCPTTHTHTHTEPPQTSPILH